MIPSKFFGGTGIALIMAVGLGTAPVLSAGIDKQAVIDNYAAIGLAGYTDALETAKALQRAVTTLLDDPSPATLDAARQAWRAARPSYQQTEAFRFGNPVVDAWEGRVNAWPLDEGLIDYVDAAYGTESDQNLLYSANVIAHERLVINGQETDVSRITPDLIQNVLQEAGGIEANVASGYHAIEFMLWGQDLNGTGPGAGNRPASDYSLENCTHGHCDRRRDYLAAATELLVADLKEMVGNWQQGGAARTYLMGRGTDGGLSEILTGMGSLSYGELAGERMKLGLLLHDPEESHDCFSDNTVFSHFYDAQGIRNVYLGTYARADGAVVSGPSMSALVAGIDPALDAEMRAKLDATMARMQVLVDAYHDGEAYDQMIAEGNVRGNRIVQDAIDALIDQTHTVERIVARLNLDTVSIEGSDSLDGAGAVFE